MSADRSSHRHNATALRVLRVDSSARRSGSLTRPLADALLDQLSLRHGELAVRVRDLAAEPPAFVDQAWVEANATPPEQRDSAQQAVLAPSDALVAELMAAEVLVIGVPLYNFGVPAKLKAWIDMVARARLTFRYTSSGPEGLLRGKKAYLVVATGGARAGGEIDFATGYLRHVLRFLGIEDVQVIAADRTLSRGAAALDGALARIAELLPAPLAATA